MEWKSVLSKELVGRIEEEIRMAYERGWQDCLQHIVACVDKARAGSVPAPPRARAERTPRGLWETIVERILRAKGTPMHVREIVQEASRTAGRPAPRASIYLALERLRERGVARQLGDRKWAITDDHPRDTTHEQAPA